MTHSRLRPLVLVPVACVVALSGCGGSAKTAAPPAATSAAASTGAPSPNSPAVTSAAATSAPAPSAKAGCPAGGGGVPAGAASRPIIDVDGDGRPDTGWAQPEASGAGEEQETYGVTTASGATFSVKIGIPAGGSGTSALFADVDNAGTVVMIEGNNRGQALWVVTGCQIVPAHNPQGQQYGFSAGIQTPPDGTGVGCSTVAGASGQTLVGLLLMTDAQGNPTSVKRTQVLIKGTSAVNGVSDTVPATDPNSQTVMSAREVTCGDLTFSGNGVQPPGSGQ